MKIKTILAGVLLGACIVSMPSDMMAQQKATGNPKSATAKKTSSAPASKGVVKKSPLTKSDLINKKYVGWFDAGAKLQGNRLYSCLDFKESGVDIQYSINEYDCVWNVNNNEVSFTFSNIPVVLYSKDNGKTLEGKYSNDNLPIKYFYLGEEGTYNKQSLKDKLMSGKYTSSLTCKVPKSVVLDVPATFKLSVDEDNPEEMSFKVTGDVAMFNFIGALKGDISFEENEIEYKGVDGEKHSLKYKDINKNVMIIPLGGKNLDNFGHMDFEVNIYFQ